MLSIVLLLDSLVPLPQEMESVWISDIVHQHNEVGFSEKFESNFLENILACDVNTVEFHSLVGVFLIELHVLDVVLAPLGHHVLMVEVLVHCLVN